MLGYVLFDKNNALAYESFVESGLAETLGYCGYNDSKLTTFVVTLKGIDPNYECS